jgi:hypothetical protein
MSSVRGEARGMDPVGREGRREGRTRHATREGQDTPRGKDKTRHELLRKGDVDWLVLGGCRPRVLSTSLHWAQAFFQARCEPPDSIKEVPSGDTFNYY